MGWLEDERGLERCKANFVPLTPLSHLNRAKKVYPDREALVYDSRRYSYSQYAERISRLASGLSRLGINPGDVVSTILLNTIPQVEAHFGVPACGAILNTINVRLDKGTIQYIIGHANPKLIVVDSQFLPLLEEALQENGKKAPVIIEANDELSEYEASSRYMEYEELIASGDPDFDWNFPDDEWESISLNYTSGTTGKPKGVVYQHRGAYLMTMGTVVSWRLTLFPKFLAIVPMFHCNGWNHSWMMPLLGGTVFCCRNISSKYIFDMIADEGISHLGGAPIVLNMLANAPEKERRKIMHKVEVFTAGAPPAPATLEAFEALNFNVTQVYGLTETFGHITECVWQDSEWENLNPDQKAEIKARQGVAFPHMEYVEVLHPETQTPVPSDGHATGEIFIRGNSVMKGYYRDPKATLNSFEGGKFASGDIAVQFPDSYIQITDRAKDIIISGGENVSSVEVEGIIMKHPSVLLCAVVAKPDQTWGEVPFAFVELKPDENPTSNDIIAFCREHLAGFKIPKGVSFGELPKTATGKIQKFQLREQLIAT
ncbi:MAG: AMP-binding protein [Rhodobacteraceae bacterium]|nr:AMP-binding protein [Paracoccaceae bacterium]MCY4249469.1 AMP-binding protein [Paracoccaceae bacterium]